MTVAVIVAALVATAAFAGRLLTLSGAIAATLVGAAAMFAGAKWVVMLLFFFVGSNLLSRWRHRDRAALVGSVVEKGGRRDAWQVIANGGVFSIAAFFAARSDAVAWEAIGIGAIAAATSDTWSTEIGTVLGGAPRSILTGREVAPGMSGGITIAGSIAALAAAVLAAVVAMSVDWSTPAAAIVAGGVAGSLIDSALGDTVQERRWCPTCDVSTERLVHSCGTTTAHRGGIRGFHNDLVNLLSTVAGAVTTWILT